MAVGRSSAKGSSSIIECLSGIARFGLRICAKPAFEALCDTTVS
jgi:hypothetical protein